MANQLPITREAIIEWLKTLPESETMGSISNYGCDCVVSKYLQDQGYDNAEVPSCLYALITVDGEAQKINLPAEVTKIVQDFDQIPGYSHTPSEVLAAISDED